MVIVRVPLPSLTLTRFRTRLEPRRVTVAVSVAGSERRKLTRSAWRAAASLRLASVGANRSTTSSVGGGPVVSGGAVDDDGAGGSGVSPPGAGGSWISPCGGVGSAFFATVTVNVLVA